MQREYHKWFSERLNRDMELLVFGHSGTPVLFFPPRAGRFYDYENWHVLEGLEHKLEQGEIQVWCVDSIDSDSLYNSEIAPEERINRHLTYEEYIIREVVPLITSVSGFQKLVCAGCSMGAYHAMNITLRHAGLFSKVLAMSGRYDLTEEKGNFRDLFDGYWNEDIYFNMPTQYLANMTDYGLIEAIQKVEIVIALGREDIFLENNELLSRLLWEKEISNQVYIWDEEAHRPRYWRQMVKEYL
jgi:esterase/lipase superfamily enzyme